MTNVDLIEEFVFSAAFSTFDQVTFVKMLCVLYFSGILTYTYLITNSNEDIMCLEAFNNLTFPGR